MLSRHLIKLEDQSWKTQLTDCCKCSTKCNQKFTATHGGKYIPVTTLCDQCQLDPPNNDVLQVTHEVINLTVNALVSHAYERTELSEILNRTSPENLRLYSKAEASAIKCTCCSLWFPLSQKKPVRYHHDGQWKDNDYYSDVMHPSEENFFVLNRVPQSVRRSKIPTVEPQFCDTVCYLCRTGKQLKRNHSLDMVLITSLFQVLLHKAVVIEN
jgi:hypothetical protein